MRAPVPGEQVTARSRLDEMKIAECEPDMPDNPAPYIIDRLHALGWAQSNGMDREPISPERMFAWQQNIGARWKPWEAKLINRLSREYLAECRRAEDPHCPAPWAPAERTQEQLDAEEARLRSVLG